MSVRTAQCRCGQLTATCEGEPVRVSVCHCLECQKRSGSAFSAQARWPIEQVRIEGAWKTWEPKEGKRASFRFCPECGSTLAYEIEAMPGLIAVVIYAVAPVIRFTNLGIRLVDKDLLEAADAFGSSAWQKMRQVQLPLALPTIMAGINQTIMLALSMVVIASMIGVQGLGQPVLKAISNQYFTMGILNGMAIVAIAIIFDRVSQAYGKRLQKHLEVVHG